MTELVAVETMSASQLEKRQRALESVIRLVKERGLDGVNMKSVSTDSGVALATLYRFFNSKEHLFAAAIVEWQQPLVRRTSRSASSDTSLHSDAHRVFSYMRRGTRAFQQDQNLLGLLIATTTSRDPFASEQLIVLRANNMAGLRARIVHAEEARAALIAEILEGCWLDVLVTWHTGRMTHAQGIDLLRAEVELLLE